MVRDTLEDILAMQSATEARVATCFCIEPVNVA